MMRRRPGRALGYVIAHLVKGVLLSDDTGRSTLVQADREIARRMAGSAAVFTSAEVKAIQDSVAARAR